MAKLDWVQLGHSADQIAEITPTLRIRAAYDDDPSNPFDYDEGCWPMAVETGSRITERTCYGGGDDVARPLVWFTAAQLMHFRFHILKIMGIDRAEELVPFNDPAAGMQAMTWGQCTDGELLKEALTAQWNEFINAREQFDMAEKLYALIDIPCWNGVRNGYSQGDTANILIIAPPTLIEQFGCTEPITPEMLASQADTYAAWAYGGCYGYVIETCEPEVAACVRCASTDNDGSDICADCGDEMEAPEPMWEEIEDGSCWGYYGSDHGESGLEEAALEALPTHTKELQHV